MSSHTKIFGAVTAIAAVLSCTVIAFELPTALNFTGDQVEMLRAAIKIVPFMALITIALYGIDLTQRGE